MREDGSMGSRSAEEWLEVFFEDHPEGGLETFDEWSKSSPALAEDAELAASVRDLLCSWLQAASVLARRFAAGDADDLDGLGSSEDVGVASTTGREGYAGDVRRRLRARGGSFDRYALRAELARGGQGAVLRVWDEDLRRTLAMKVVLGDPGERTGDTPGVDAKTLARFLEEAQVTGQLDHPGVVPVHELGLDASGRVYFTMKLVKGEDLRSVFRKVHEEEDGWTLAKGLGVMLKVCEAMAYAHSKRVIHRDLKPANVMVGRFGEVYVMDWGLARVLDREDTHDLRIRPNSAPEASTIVTGMDPGGGSDSPLVTMDGDVVGTPAYMSPEQAAGKVEELGPQSDVYAVGAMLYHLLTGRMPYVDEDGGGSNRAVWARVKSGPPESVASLAPRTHPALLAIVEKAMARRWRKRYANMSELAADLSAFLEDRVVAAYERGAWAEAKTWVRRNRALASALGAAGIFLVVGLLVSSFALRRWSRAAVLAEERLELAGERERDARENARLLAEKQAEAERLASEYEEAASWARENERIARDAAARAEVAAADSARAAALALRQSYQANVALAQLELFTDDRSAARRRLWECDPALRGWEWQNLEQLCSYLQANVLFTGRARNALRGSHHETKVVSTDLWQFGGGSGVSLFGAERDRRGSALVVAGSHDGTRYAAAYEGGLLRVHDSLTGKEVQELRGTVGVVRALEFGLDDETLHGVGDLGLYQEWFLRTGSPRRFVQLTKGHVECASFSRGGGRLALGGNDGTVHVGDPASGEPLRLVDTWTSPLRAIDVTHDADVLLSATALGVRAYDLSREEPVIFEWTTPEHRRMNVACLSEDGRFAAVGTSEVVVFDLSGSTEPRTLVEVLGRVDSLGFSPDATRLAVGTNDGTLRLWNHQDRTAIYQVRGHPAPVQQVGFWSEGERLMSHSTRGIMLLESIPAKVRSSRSKQVLERRTAAHRVVGLLAERPGADRARVLAQLDADATIDPEVRELAKLITMERPFLAEEWFQAAWDVILDDHADPKARGESLRWAERARAKEPSRSEYVVAHAAALYRSQRHEEALAELVPLLDSDADDALALAVRTLVLHAMGRRNLARSSAARLHHLVQRDPWARDPALQSILPTVRTVLERRIGEE